MIMSMLKHRTNCVSTSLADFALLGACKYLTDLHLSRDTQSQKRLWYADAPLWHYKVQPTCTISRSKTSICLHCC